MSMIMHRRNSTNVSAEDIGFDVESLLPASGRGRSSSESKPSSIQQATGKRVSISFRIVAATLFAMATVAGVAWLLRLSPSSRHEDASSPVVGLGSSCTNDDMCGDGNACLFRSDTDPSAWRAVLPAPPGIPIYDHVGKCIKDHACSKADACNGRGSCVLGTCTCDFGFSGPDCELSSRAYVTLVFGAKERPEHLLQILALKVRLWLPLPLYLYSYSLQHAPFHCRPLSSNQVQRRT